MESRTLKIYLERLKRLDRILSETEADLKSQKEDESVYYSVDFSELFAYFNPKDETIKHFSTEITTNPETSSERHRLGLYHLFNSLTDKLYLLPPYVIELWSYSRRQADNHKQFNSSLETAQKFLSQLSSAHFKFLKSLNDKTTLTTEEENTLFTIVKEDFQKICAEATNFFLWKKQATDLHFLIKEKKISYEIEELLKRGNFASSDLQDVTRQEEMLVLQFFSKEDITERYYQKLRDSRAIIFIRNLNHLFASRNSKLVFVTRDNSIREVAEILLDVPELDCSEVLSCLRAPESVFFNLILFAFETSEEKLSWLNDSKNALKKMEKDLIEIEQPKSFYSESQSHNNKYFQQQKQEVLESVFKSWNERVNLQLSRATKKIPWLSDTEIKSSQLNNKSLSTLTSVKNLLEFVKSNEYEEKAIYETEKVWDELLNDGLRMIFLKNLKLDITNLKDISVTRIYDEKKGAFLLPPSSSMMPFIRFTSTTYENRLNEFKRNLNKYSKSFKEIIPLITEATSGIGEPEDFMFMAFILGMLTRWTDAFQMVERALELEVNNFDVAQAYYFRAFIQRRLAEDADDLPKIIEYYEYAENDIQKALNKELEDPRYLKEYGAIVLLYLDAWRRFVRSDEYKFSILKKRGMLESLNLEKAKKHLKKGWEMQKNNDQLPDDDRLRIEILNNIVYAEALSQNPDLELAHEFLNLMKNELTKIKDTQRSVFLGLEPIVRDTEIMLRAKIAFTSKKTDDLSKCIEELKYLGMNYTLSSIQTELNYEHIQMLKEWLETIE